MTRPSAAPASSSASAAAASSNGSGSRHGGGFDRLLITVELALTAVTVCAVLGMNRLFEDTSYRAPVVVQVVVAHLFMALIRRRNLPLRAAWPLTVALAAVSIAWTQYADTTWLALPSLDTLTAAQTDIDTAWRLFQDVRAPAPVEPGFVVATSLAVWLIAFIADWGAFRTGVSFEALLPPSTLFLFGAVLGAEGGRAANAALFVGAALLFLLLHRTWRQEDTVAWVASHHRQARRALVLAGAGLGTLAVAVAGIVGPSLPGANSTGVIPWKDIRPDDQTRVVVSPLVDIQSRLVEQPNLQVFTVRGQPDSGQYWRLTALDEFTGTIWRSAYRTEDAEGGLPSSIESGATRQQASYQIDIEALAAIWLPAPYEPRAIETNSDTAVHYDDDSATLIVDRENPSSDGLSYGVTSEIPTWTADQLRTASPEIPDDIAERYLDLPNDFSGQITELAEEMTAGATTAYDKAIALQSWFRNDFEYSLEVQLRSDSNHSQDALEQFLFETRTGYCEQFAGALGAMARSIGIPARVVVGFTRGSEDPNEPGLYVVTGKQAHAWVELYFEGYGWVTFDPTPGRSPVGAENWLGIPGGLQDDPNGAGSTTTTAPGAPQPAPTTPAAPGASPGSQDGVEVMSPSSGEDDEDDDFLPVLPDTPAAIARPPAIAALGYLLLVPLGIVIQRQRRRRRARAPAQQVDLAWQEVNEDVTGAGLQLSPSLTVAERANRMRLALPAVAPSVDVLAHALEQVTYAERTPTPEEATVVTAAAAEVSTAAARQQPWGRRALRYLDARRLVASRDRARRSAHGAERSNRPQRQQ